MWRIGYNRTGLSSDSAPSNNLAVLHRRIPAEKGWLPRSFQSNYESNRHCFFVNKHANLFPYDGERWALQSSHYCLDWLCGPLDANVLLDETIWHFRTVCWLNHPDSGRYTVLLGRNALVIIHVWLWTLLAKLKPLVRNMVCWWEQALIQLRRFLWVTFYCKSLSAVLHDIGWLE